MPFPGQFMHHGAPMAGAAPSHGARRLTVARPSTAGWAAGVSRNDAYTGGYRPNKRPTFRAVVDGTSLAISQGAT